jgi:hypothetical protein
VRSRLAENHDKLVAADARYRIRAAHHTLQPSGDLLQEFVSSAVAQGIIDVFEAIEIEDAYRKPLARPFPLLDALAQPIIQQEPVGKARKRVMGGQLT